MPKLTKTLVEKAESRNTRYKVWDDEIKGLGVEVLPSGRKTYQFFYTSPLNNKFTYLKIGNHGGISCETAREIALEWKTLLTKRIDPKEQLQKQREEKQLQESEEKRKISLGEFLDIYIERHVKTLKPNTIKRDINRIHVLKRHEQFCAKSLEAITTNDILELKSQLVKTPIQFNRIKGILSNVFNQSETWGFKKESTNPCKGVESYKENKRKTYLSLEQTKRLEEIIFSLKEKANHSAVLSGLLLILYTGCRHGEIRCLRWDEVSLKDKCFHFKDSKTGSKTIPLNDAAVKILSDLAREPEQIYVFPGQPSSKPVSSFLKTWEAIRKQANLRHVTIHDLRHTFASLGIKAGLSLYDISKLLGHSNITTTMRYAHLQQAELIKSSNKITELMKTV